MGCCLDNGMLVIDANWRWSHDISTPEHYDNCYEGHTWAPELCPDPSACVRRCAIEGEDEAGYLRQFGVSTAGDRVKLNYVTHHEYGTNVGSRVYMMQGDSYKIYRLKNREFTFTVDVSTLECGINGALYFVEMPADGDLGKGNNQAGAHYGTGYCDAQCAMDEKWIAGSANVPLGSAGYCCAEVDMWEANVHAASYSMHTCTGLGAETCSGKDCGSGLQGEASRSQGKCDRDGCDYNSYRLGEKTYFGPGSSYTIDSTQPFTVTTQFLTRDGTDNSELVEIKRIYKQNDVVVENSVASILPPVQRGGKTGAANSLTAEFCALEKDTFADPDDFGDRGGLEALSDALDRGMVLVMSIWDDHSTGMEWLDSAYPAGRNQVGDERGNCPNGRGDPEKVRADNADAYVTFGDIRFGAISATQSGDAGAAECPGSPVNIYSPELPVVWPNPSAAPAASVTTMEPESPTPAPVAHSDAFDASGSFPMGDFGRLYSDETGPLASRPTSCLAFAAAVVFASLVTSALLAVRTYSRVSMAQIEAMDEERLATPSGEEI